ncbi:MAG: hypothetical protein EA351_00980 [Gemmatimonadales bacterium]|nr:MAG: hypothetical protein EA351_00980 [Gemmatimonadales bacterium]
MNDMTRFLGGSILGWILFLGIAEGAEAQVIEDCEEPCGIEVTEIAMLGGDDAGVGFVGRPRSLARLSDGRFLLADFHEGDRIKIYGPDGTYQRSVGRRGEGPGEYGSVASITRLAGDTIEVYDDASFNDRITILTSDFQVVETRRTGLPTGPRTMTTLSDGSRVMNRIIHSPAIIGLPLHTVSPEGELVRSFGADPPIEDLRNGQLHFRWLATASDSTVWAAHRVRYTIEEWSVEGNMMRELTRQVPWFPPVERGGFIDAESPPNPELGPIHSDRAGLLWVVVQVPSANWEEALEMQPDPYGRQRLVPGNPRLYQDALIEVIDPGTGRIVARTRTDHRILGFVADGLVYTYDETESMEPVVRILELSLAAGASR